MKAMRRLHFPPGPKASGSGKAPGGARAGILPDLGNIVRGLGKAEPLYLLRGGSSLHYLLYSQNLPLSSNKEITMPPFLQAQNSAGKPSCFVL